MIVGKAEHGRNKTINVLMDVYCDACTNKTKCLSFDSSEGEYGQVNICQKCTIAWLLKPGKRQRPERKAGGKDPVTPATLASTNEALSKTFLDGFTTRHMNNIAWINDISRRK